MSTGKRMTAEARREVIERAATDVFAERGYRGTTVGEIARRSGVSVPVIYDHFTSKRELYAHLVERHYGELRHIWFGHAPGDAPGAERVPRAIAAWFAYMESHRSAARLLFRDTTGDPEIEATHRAIQARSRAALLPLMASEGAAADIDTFDGDVALEMAWEAFRAPLQALALWWYEHPDVPRQQVYAAAMNFVWLGFERILQGETWPVE